MEEIESYRETARWFLLTLKMTSKASSTVSD
jgi:hypothetical protein